MSSIGAFQMSSRNPVSTARPKTFWSIEYGFFLVVSIGSPLLLGEGDRLVPGQGEVTDRGDALQVGGQGWMPTSKRTWSLPLPVQPWATVVAPCSRAAATRCLTITGRESAETSG